MHSQTSFEKKPQTTQAFYITGKKKTEITTTVSRKNISANTGKARCSTTPKQVSTTAAVRLLQILWVPEETRKQKGLGRGTVCRSPMIQWHVCISHAIDNFKMGRGGYLEIVYLGDLLELFGGVFPFVSENFCYTALISIYFDANC